jgi:hypothetical protein
VTLRQYAKQAEDRLDSALILLMGHGTRRYVSQSEVRMARQEVRDALSLLQDGAMGPRSARSARIAREVSLTGLEQELPL